MRAAHVIVAALFIILLSGSVECCSILLNQPMNVSEDLIIQQITGWTPTEKQILECLKLSLNKGLFEVAETLVALTPTIKSPQFHQIYDEQLKQLSQFSRSLIVGWTRLSPIVKWAQSNDTVLISFKLSHRWDSPPCTYTKSESYTFENNTLDYHNECIVSRQRIYFRLLSRFWGQVDTKEGSFEIKKDGVGTYMVTLKKKHPQIWLYLDESKENFQIWGEIAERYKPAMNEYSRLIETEEAKPQKKGTAKAGPALALLLLMASMIM